MGGTFVLAMTRAPAPFTRVVSGASCSERKSLKCVIPTVVRSPRTLIDSFRVIGSPSGVASRALEVELDERVQLRIVTLDPPAEQLEELDGGHTPCAERGEQVGGGR